MTEESKETSANPPASERMIDGPEKIPERIMVRPGSVEPDNAFQLGSVEARATDSVRRVPGLVAGEKTLSPRTSAIRRDPDKTRNPQEEYDRTEESEG